MCRWRLVLIGSLAPSSIVVWPGIKVLLSATQGARIEAMENLTFQSVSAQITACECLHPNESALGAAGLAVNRSDIAGEVGVDACPGRVRVSGVVTEISASYVVLGLVTLEVIFEASLEGRTNRRRVEHGVGPVSNLFQSGSMSVLTERVTQVITESPPSCDRVQGG
jgi:hypothetical protein